MKNHTLAGSICALLLTALGASSAVAQTATSEILFARTAYRASDNAHGSALYRIASSGSGAVQLASVTYGSDYVHGSWSPNGTAVVYEVDKQDQDEGGYSGAQLFVVDRQGGSPHQITTGTSAHQNPMWAPTSGIIAYEENGCLATVRANGTSQHIVFCAPRDPGMGYDPRLTLLRWTPSGNGVLVVAGATEGGLDPRMWYSDVYRVNVSTGLATKLSQQVLDASGYGLAIAPDGTHGVYGGHPMQLIDLTTDTLTPLSTGGSNMMYSPDGTKIAFFKQTKTYPYVQNVYVMNADGSNVRALTQTVPNRRYLSIAGWSRNSTRVLANMVGNDWWMRLINVQDKTAVNVARGTAFVGAWRHP